MGKGWGGGVGVPEGVGDNSNPPAVRERKQDFSFCFSIRGVGGVGGGTGKTGASVAARQPTFPNPLKLVQR